MMCRSVSPLLFLLLLLGCGSSVDDADSTQGAGVGAEYVAAPARYHAYEQLTGQIGDFPISMNLLRATEPGLDDIVRYSGNYYYDRVKHPIQISGYLRNDTLLISEPGRLSGPSHEFRLVPNGEPGAFTGLWINGNTQRSLPVRLEAKAAAEPAFTIREVIDSMPLQPGSATSPKAHFSLTWLEAEPGGAPDKVTFINQQIHEEVLGLPTGKSTGSGVLALRDSFFYYYREDAEAIGSDDPDNDFSAMLNYDQSSQMEVIYASDSLLSLSVMDYEYSGGAHGNYGTRLYTLDLQERRLLTLTDVLEGNYETRLTAALGTAVREYFELDRNDPLSVVLFEDSVYPTENFALTPTGILFDYPPYEIAAYAVGEIQLFVPFERLQSYLKSPYRQW